MPVVTGLAMKLRLGGGFNRRFHRFEQIFFGDMSIGLSFVGGFSR